MQLVRMRAVVIIAKRGAAEQGWSEGNLRCFVAAPTPEKARDRDAPQHDTPSEEFSLQGDEFGPRVRAGWRLLWGNCVGATCGGRTGCIRRGCRPGWRTSQTRAPRGWRRTGSRETPRRRRVAARVGRDVWR